MGLTEFLSQIGLKIILIVVAAFVICFGILFSFLYFSNQQSSSTQMEKTSYYDSSTTSIVLANNTASFSGMANCDIFVSGPSKQMKYFNTVNCSSLSSTEISKQDLLDMFGGQKGIYTIIVNPAGESTASILQFSIA